MARPLTASKHVANPDLLAHEGKYLFYFRGQGAEGHDQIGVAFCREDAFDGMHWTIAAESPIVKVSPCPDDFDSRHILDPAAICLGQEMLLYYSGHSYDRLPAVGLAISEDGVHFKKSELSPVVLGCFVPEVVLHEGQVHLFYQRPHPDGSLVVGREAWNHRTRGGPAPRARNRAQDASDSRSSQNQP